MKIKTTDLMPLALNWAVANIELTGHDDYTNLLMVTVGDDEGWKYTPSTDWAQGGPIIEREGLTLTHQTDKWAAQTDCDLFSYGPTPLIAAMRCYVASKLGEIVGVPRELYKED